MGFQPVEPITTTAPRRGPALVFRRFGALTMALGAAAGLLGPAPAAAQDDPLPSCSAFSADADACHAVRQALHSAVPQVGIAVLGGSPLPGTASVAGVRLGFVPGLTLSLRANAAGIKLPDVRYGQQNGVSNQASKTLLYAGADAAVALFQGFSSGTASGIGALDLLLSAGVLPGNGGLRGSLPTYGAGVRVGLLRETFGTPGVSLTGAWRGTGQAEYGGACAGGGSCAAGTAPALAWHLHALSTRLVMGKRVARVGLSGGAGYDHYSDGNAHFTASSGGALLERRERVGEGRWSAFAGLSWALPAGALTAEGGWMQGGDAVAGYPSGAAYDPGAGTPFGSLSLRLSL
jgi:hypothetical protein